MGVLACNRRDCENVMCSRYSSRHGYICDECFDELVHAGVRIYVPDFMASPKEQVLPQATRDYFEEVFPLTNN